MALIELLNQDTIDKIAAGEVVERPASVVKELVENAIDAKATIITVEIEKGGTAKIRVSDNGMGIPASEVKKAFLRHSTSKLRDASDLSIVKSLGFRGEALSSIAAVSKLELITKTEDDMLGTHYEIEGSREVVFEEIGAPQGSTFIVRDLFYNTLPRQKFLKSPRTEGNYIGEIVEKLALSHPDIAFQLSIDGKNRLSTIGSGKLKDTIYQIFGKNITDNLIAIDEETDVFSIHGYIGNSTVVKGNRAYENIFINNRYVKSKAIASAIEEAYVGYVMQHQYPFFCLFLDINTELVDVNVHPTKMEVRIENQKELDDEIKRIIYDEIHREEGIIEYSSDEAYDVLDYSTTQVELDESEVLERVETLDKSDDVIDIKTVLNKIKNTSIDDIEADDVEEDDTIIEPYEVNKFEEKSSEIKSEIVRNVDNYQQNDKTEQLSFLSEEAVQSHKIIGQLFSTYWLVEYDKNLYIIDQHAAHEKVLYEKTVAAIKNNEMTSQQISPPVIVTLSAAEEEFLSGHMDVFEKVGYDIENFGGHEYAITGIPYNIYGVDAKTLFLDMIGDCTDITTERDNAIILEKIASMSCKAAIKGNTDISVQEAKALIDELLELDNPFHCPHGRPTIIKMSQYEIDKKFGRIQ